MTNGSERVPEHGRWLKQGRLLRTLWRSNHSKKAGWQGCRSPMEPIWVKLCPENNFNFGIEMFIQGSPQMVGWTKLASLISP
jgi:hypothetical protein